jgi:hypothetical protein
MKQNAIVIYQCQFFSIFEHGVELNPLLCQRYRIVGNARMRPRDQIENEFYGSINPAVAAWRIDSLRGVTGVVNPGGKTDLSLALCPEGEMADETVVERQARLDRSRRIFEEDRLLRWTVIPETGQCAPYDAAELQRAGLSGCNVRPGWRRINAPQLDADIGSPSDTGSPSDPIGP